MKPQIIEFESEDTEGSDLSYESSFDEKLDQDFQAIQQQREVSQFKDQMHRFIMQNPDLKDNIVLEKAEFEDEEEKASNLGNNLVQQKGARRIITNSNIPRVRSQPQQPFGQWENVSSHILNNSKKIGGTPTIEEFHQRMNVFRRKSENVDVVDFIIAEQDKLFKDIALQAKRNKERDNAIHQSIEAKVRKETGNVGYVSYRKRIQFQFRIKKAEELAQEKVDKQQKERELELKKSRGIFEKLFQEKKNQEGEVQIEGDFKSLAAEELYKKIKKCQDETEIKQTIIQFIIQHKKKMVEDYWNKPTILQQGAKFYSEDTKEFSLLAPNFNIKKQLQGKIPLDYFDKRENLEEGNQYLLSKVNRIINGNLMNYWKQLQENKR